MFEGGTKIAWKVGMGNIFCRYDCWMRDKPLASLLPEELLTSCQLLQVLIQDNWNVNVL